MYVVKGGGAENFVASQRGQGKCKRCRAFLPEPPSSVFDEGSLKCFDENLKFSGKANVRKYMFRIQNTIMESMSPVHLA